MAKEQQPAVVAQTVMLPISKIETNHGQIDGLPKNPRILRDEQYKRLKKSIEDNPEMLTLRELLVYPHGGKYVVIGGNMRLRILQDLGEKEVPCKIIAEDTSVDKLRAYTIKDNTSGGEWDWDDLANEWDESELDAWGLELPDMGGEETEEDDEEVKDGERIEEVEEWLNDAMRRNASEFYEMLEHNIQKGWLAYGLTQGYCEAQFLKSKFYNKSYPAVCSLYFQPRRFWTNSGVHNNIVPTAIKAVGEGRKSGLKGLRTATADGMLCKMYACQYPIAAAAAADFPALIARKLYEEFAHGGDVLDPCHGWGGRLTGALMADVASYTGVDPSSYAHSGAERIGEAYGKYSKTIVNLIQQPFEEVKLKKDSFDFALTSPPYFDVEKYEGEGQAHLRYSQYDKWVEGFYEPLIKGVFDALRKGSVFVLQVGSQSYPLKKDGLKIAAAVGFELVEERPLGGGTSNGFRSKNGSAESENNEKLLILRKP